MSNEEQHKYLCGMFAKLVDGEPLTGEEVLDLASELGIKVSDFCTPEPLEIIDWKRAA